jgi:fumarate reductase (CoM/CoB) subunit A
LWYVGDSPKGQEAVQTALNIAQYKYIKSHGVDPAFDKIEVAPGAHYLLGGIFINEQCRTSVQGLFATPECAGNFDGANRLAGSGIAATQVFGARAGLAAHKWAVDGYHAEADTASLDEEAWRVAGRVATGRYSGTAITGLRDKLRSAVQLYAGVTRDATGLSRLLQVAAEVREEAGKEKAPPMAVYNQQLVDLLQLDAMCEIAGLVAGSALMRQESRGHHFRSDFPALDNVKWANHTMTACRESGPAFGTKPVIKL